MKENQEEGYAIFEAGEHVIVTSQNIYELPLQINYHPGYEVFAIDGIYIYYRNIEQVKASRYRGDYPNFGTPQSDNIRTR